MHCFNTLSFAGEWQLCRSFSEADKPLWLHVISLGITTKKKKPDTFYKNKFANWQTSWNSFIVVHDQGIHHLTSMPEASFQLRKPPSVWLHFAVCGQGGSASQILPHLFVLSLGFRITMLCYKICTFVGSLGGLTGSHRTVCITKLPLDK